MLSLYTAATNTRLETEPWRLFTSHDVPGALNMAVDEVLLGSVIAGGSPVVRFYTWKPAALSLGVNQPVGEVHLAECAARGFDVVRRLTGGRAVLHQYELTYSVIARENDMRVSGGVIESYRKISAALVEGLSSLGAAVSLAPHDRASIRSVASRREEAALAYEGETATIEGHSAVCFDAASAYELTSSGKKLVGSAQARRGGALLQHGSILLDIDWEAWVSVFQYATEAGKQRAYSKLPARMTSLRHELGRVVHAEEVVASLQPAFERLLSVSLESSRLSVEEGAAAQELAVSKYGSEDWTERV